MTLMLNKDKDMRLDVDKVRPISKARIPRGS